MLYGAAMICIVIAVISLAPLSAAAGELVVNGDFEAGGFSGGWVDGAGNVMGPLNPDWADHLVSLDMPAAGNYSALLGFKYTEPQQHRYGFMYYDVTIPDRADYTSYLSILDAVSTTDGTVSESVSAIITVGSINEIDLWIDGNGDDIYGPLGMGLGGFSSQAAAPGDTLFFTITFENESGTDLFDLSWTAPPGWEVLIGDSTSTMRGVTSGVYVLEVRVPTLCPGGTFDIILDGRKADKPYLVDSVMGCVYIRGIMLNALIDGRGDGDYGTSDRGNGGFSYKSADMGTSVGFLIELQNEGDEADNYIISWSDIPDWTAEIDAGAVPFTTPTIQAQSSDLFVFTVDVPLSASEGDYSYIIDVQSVADTRETESIQAGIGADNKTRLDLVIDGDGLDRTAPAGTGAGGSSLLYAEPGTLVTAVLEIIHRGSFLDSVRVTWDEPTGWPEGSVLLSDGINDYVSPFVIDLQGGGTTLTYTVKIFVPLGATLPASFVMDAVTILGGYEDSITIDINPSTFVVAAMVFDDVDHDGAYDPGEPGLSGVTVRVTDPGGEISRVTGVGGTCFFGIPVGIDRDVIEVTPQGMFSLSSDTVSIGSGTAGDTTWVYFADVMGPLFVPNGNVNAPAGGFADLAHTITAGTTGQAALTAALPAGWIEIFYRDNNSDGLLDPGDTILTAADLDLDPAVPGRDVVPVIMRVFIPPTVPAGTVEVVAVTLEQVFSGTAVTARVVLLDRVQVLAAASGLLRLVKEVDLAAAQPGDVITYTIVFSNPGTESVQEIEIIDFLPPEVDIVIGAFGPGRDIAWIAGAVTTYLTADPTDPDEALYSSAVRSLQIVLSRQAPFVLGSGEEGRIIYRVSIR